MFVKNNFDIVFKRLNRKKSSAGFTLIELLVAMSLTLIVTSLTGFGLVAIMTNNNKAEAKTQRRIEINRALAFISDEVRMARRINPTNTTDNNTAAAGDAVLASNTAKTFSPPLGLVVTLAGADTSIASITSDDAVKKQVVLYLEIPLTPITTTTCPAGGPNAGSIPPTADRVVYYIRSESSEEWLGPRVIKRYGRTPEPGGTTNPCSNPSSETFVDSISTNPNTSYVAASSCPSPAKISGTEGFYACVNGRKVDIYLRSKVSNTATDDENSKTTVSSRMLTP